MKIGLHVSNFTWPGGAATLAADLCRVAAAAEEQGQSGNSATAAQAGETPSPPGWTGARGTATRLLLLRHGQSEGNVDRKVYADVPDYALQLSELGRQQARDAGQRINPLLTRGTGGIRFYVSPRRRRGR